MKLYRPLAALVATVALAVGVHAASVSTITGPQDPSQMNAVLNQTINAINAGIPSLPGKNVLDNGLFTINQRGTAVATGGTTSGPGVAAYVSDRWAVNTNVGSGAGRGQVVTSAAGVTFAPGLPNAVSLFRNSGALTQPVQLEQFIETARSQALAGKSVIMSCFLANNAVVPAGNAATMDLFFGTGTDQGLGALRSAVGMTASPALTPALTGVGTAGSFTTAALTSTSTRYSSGPIAVPLTATELIFSVRWTPGAETAGSTNGIIVQGCQLEQADPNQTTASPLEVDTMAVQLARAQRFFWQVTDAANTVVFPSACFVTSANTTVKCGYWLPTQMQAAPVTAISTATSFGIIATAGTAGTCTTLAATASSNTVTSIGLTCTTGATIALGSATPLIGAATAGTINASADY